MKTAQSTRELLFTVVMQ